MQFCLLTMLVTGLLAAWSKDAKGQEHYRWQPVAIGAGGFLTGFDSDPGGRTRVVRTDVYGAYLWLEPEARWTQLVVAASMPASDRRQSGLADGVYAIAVSPSRPDRIFMAIRGHVYRSDNRGASFQRVSSGAPFPIDFDANSEFRMYGPHLAVAPDDPDLVLFGTPNRGLLMSRDGGRTWMAPQGIPQPRDLRAKAVHQSPGVTIWFEPASSARPAQGILAMSPGHGVFRSVNGGQTFAPLANSGPAAPTNLRRGSFAPDGTFYAVDPESKSIWRYRAGAWDNLTTRPGLSALVFAAIAVNPRNGQIFAFDAGGRPYRSSDGGESWVRLKHRSKVGPGDPPWLRVSNHNYFATGMVAFDPTVPHRMLNTAGTGYYYADVRPDADTLEWISQTRGIEELVANDVVKPTGRAPLFAAWDFGIHRKEDLGAFSTGYGPRERVLIAAQQLAWSERHPDFVVTNASDTLMSCCWQDGQSVLAGYSTDAGRTWTRFEKLPHPAGTRPDDPWRMSFGMIAVSSGNPDNIIWVPSFNRQPFYTKDRGRSWHPVVLPSEIGPNTGSHAAFHLQRKTLTADRVEDGTFYFYHAGDGQNAHLLGLWRTTDGGTSWARMSSGEIAASSRRAAKLRAAPGHKGHLFFTSGVAGGGDTRLRRSIDGGASWTALAGVDAVDDIGLGRSDEGAVYPTIFVSGRVYGRYGIWRSTDNAVSWQRLAEFPVGTLDQVTVIEGDRDTFGRVFVGYKGSGWRYGEPSSCNPAPHRFPDESQCVRVE
jgi:photosystem II stability/assembly factor-like uncharacterized protein